MICLYISLPNSQDELFPFVANSLFFFFSCCLYVLHVTPDFPEEVPKNKLQRYRMDLSSPAGAFSSKAILYNQHLDFPVVNPRVRVACGCTESEPAVFLQPFGRKLFGRKIVSCRIAGRSEYRSERVHNPCTQDGNPGSPLPPASSLEP